MGSHEAYLRSALSMYRHSDLAKRDITNCIQQFTELRPQRDTFVFNDGNRRELLCLDGTIPVTYKGSQYNIPVCLWLLDTHPYNPPMVYVKPTQTMQIKPGRHVDSNGRVYLPYLHDWKQQQSKLLELIEILTVVFSEQPPVFDKRNPDIVLNFTKISPDLLYDYQHADKTKLDITNCIRQFSDLRVRREIFRFADGNQDELLCLSGTFPVRYRGVQYDIPVCLWLSESHPYNPPMAYVKPTETMQIKPGRNVDKNGCVSLTYLEHWEYPVSDLLGLIRVMAVLFSEELPLQQVTNKK